MGAQSLMECESWLALDFRNSYPNFFHRAQMSLEVMVDDPAGNYAFHRAFLQHRQYGAARRRWALKGTEHHYNLEVVKSTYPDAHVVWIHRDPMKLMPSYLELFAMMRESLYAAVVADALDSLGLRNQSPRVCLQPFCGDSLMVGRCKTTLWADMYHEDPRPYELELQAVDGCRADDVMIAAAGGSCHSALWGELLSTAARNAGCLGAIVDGAIRDVAKMRQMEFPVFARQTSVYDSQNRQRVIDIDVPVK